MLESFISETMMSNLTGPSMSLSQRLLKFFFSCQNLYLLFEIGPITNLNSIGEVLLIKVFWTPCHVCEFSIVTPHKSPFKTQF